MSVIVTAAVRAPVAVGMKVTFTVQLVEAANVDGLTGQFVVCAKSPALVPVIAMLLIVSAPGPLLVTVMACEVLVVFLVWLPKLSEVGERLTEGAAATPVPLSEIDRGLPLPLSVTVTVAVRDPDAGGVNVTLIVQLDDPASVDGLSGQFVVCAKSEAFVPVTAMLPIVNAPGP